MKTFLLYGSDACAVYRSEGIDELFKYANNKLFGSVDIFDTENPNVLNTLSNYSEWNDVIEISEAEYDILSKYWW